MCSRFCSLLLDSLSTPLCFSSEKHSEAAATEPLPGTGDGAPCHRFPPPGGARRNQPNKPSPCHFSVPQSQISEPRRCME